MARISAKGGKSAGLQRLALFGFAALFILLFVIFAIAEGIGHPSVPSDAVAGIPADYGAAMIANTLSLLATITTTDDLLQAWQPAEGTR